MIRRHSFSLILSLTTVANLGIPLAVEAASFDYDQLQLIPVRPIPSNTFLSFFGDPDNNEGQTSFYNPDPMAPDSGHVEISLNAPGNIAPYYGAGRNASPEETGATRAATLEGLQGFSNLLNYLTDNSIALDTIGVGYGLKTPGNFTETYNLGDDILGQDWFATPTSTVEERIYQADPDLFEVFLSFNDEKIINFDYSPSYAILDYGETTATEDDFEALLSNPIGANKVMGLTNLADGLADAFLLDVKRGGGAVQVVTELEGIVDPAIDFNNGFVIFSLDLPVELRVVSTVPEPSSVLGLLTLTSMGIFSVLKKAKN